MTKFMNDNKQQIYNDAWDKIRGSNAISYTNPILSKGVNYGPKIESMLSEFKENSGVRLDNLRQEVNRRMAKRSNMLELFQNKELFESNTSKDKQHKCIQLLGNSSLKQIVETIKDQLIGLEAKNTAPSGIYVVIQMYLVHVKMLKMLKRNKETNERPVKFNKKYKFNADDWNTDSESDSDDDSETDNENYSGSDSENYSENDSENDSEIE
eukprot:81766_1